MTASYSKGWGNNATTGGATGYPGTTAASPGAGSTWNHQTGTFQKGYQAGKTVGGAWGAGIGAVVSIGVAD